MGGVAAMSTDLYAATASVSYSPGTNKRSSTSDAAAAPENTIPDGAIRDAVRKAQEFEHDYDDDIYASHSQSGLLRSVLLRLGRLQRTVGYGNFNLIDFDSARYYASRYSSIGAFTDKETDLIEELFEYDASNYGFFGHKVSPSLTAKIRRQDVKKIRGTGHFLYQGESLDMYNKIKRQMGDDLILTSGIRSVVKQIHLFIAKVEKSGGNLSRAARSLAPPGHSFHGIGDFDVGKRGLGAANFTNTFAETRIYTRLNELGYISMRYPMANPYGVRYEPWHIKVVEDV
jgi:hypothetical protein